MKKKIMASAVALLLAVSLTFALADDSVAVRVGDFTYSVEQVQKYIGILAVNIAYSSGQTVAQIYPDGAHEEFLQDIAEHFVMQGVIESKARDLGLDQLSEEEKAELNAYAQENYEALWQQFSERLKERDPEVEYSDREVTEIMENMGYSMNAILEEATLLMKQSSLIERFCGDISVSDEEARAYYEENYLNPARERYENNVPLFEREVLLQSGTTCYAPEGYFYIKYILLNPSEEVSRPVKDAGYKLLELQGGLQQAQSALSLAALDPDADLDAARRTYQDAEAKVAEAEKALDEASAKAEESYMPMYEIVTAAMADGVPFEKLMEQYSISPEMISEEQPGFPFHPDSELWYARLSEKTGKLEKRGDVTEPVYAMDGIYLVCRMADMQCGEYEPDQETMDQLKENMLADRQTAALDELVAQWREDYEIETDISGLTFPLK